MSAKVSPEHHEKQVAYMRKALMDRGYDVALAALEFGLSKHTGKRKDDYSPEFSHQMFIAFYILSIVDLLEFPEETLAVAFLHDICEDKGVTYEEIEAMFGRRIRIAVESITKLYMGVRIPDDVYYERMATDRIASVVKGVDRAHNLFSMLAAGWSVEKMQDYVDFVFDKLLPMLKKARKTFRKQEAAYQNLKTVLLMQIAPIQEYLALKKQVA